MGNYGTISDVFHADDPKGIIGERRDPQDVVAADLEKIRKRYGCGLFRRASK